MDKGFLHLHVTVVSLFILFFAYKLFLLLSNKKESLVAFRQKTKIADMVLGSLIVVTGAYLLFAAPKVETYIVVKIILTFAIIPLGIVGMKKENKVLSILTMVILIYVFTVGKTRSLSLMKQKIEIVETTLSVSPVDSSSTNNSIIDQNTQTSLSNGKAIYTQVCAACHGLDGKLGTSGAKDLSISIISHEETLNMITNGKGLMQAYKEVLSEQEITSVATYIETLRVK